MPPPVALPFLLLGLGRAMTTFATHRRRCPRSPPLLPRRLGRRGHSSRFVPAGEPMAATLTLMGGARTRACHHPGNPACHRHYRIAGQLGDGVSGGKSNVPVAVSGLAGGTAVAAGGSHSLAIAGGQLEAWGSNSNGELGNGEHSNTASPAPVQVACGLQSLQGITASQEASYAWGADQETFPGSPAWRHPKGLRRAAPK